MAKNHKMRNIALVGVALLAVYVIFVNPDILEGSNLPVPTTTTTPVDDSGTINSYEGPITVQFPSSDAGDPSLSYGEDTELDIIVYRLNSDGSFNRLGAPSQVEVGILAVTSSPDLKTVYAEFSVATGQDYYVDASSVSLLNSRSAGAPQWLDLNNDGRPTYVFPIDISGFPANPATTPQFDFVVELIDEGTFTIDSPADVSVSATGKQRCNIKYSLDSTNSGDGIAVTRIRATLNETNTDMWYPLDSNISFPTGMDPNSAKQKIFLNEFAETELATTYRYDYKLGAGDLDDAQFLTSPLNGETDFEIPFELWVNMDVIGASGIELTLEIQTHDVHGNPSTTNDPVVCNNL